MERVRREALHCTVPIAWPWEEGHSWKANIKKVLPGTSNHLVVGDALDPSPFMGWELALEQIRETRKRSWAFHGVTHEYVRACIPLLINSPAAYLVDPYFDPLSPEGRELVTIFLDKAKGSRCYSIELITRQARDIDLKKKQKLRSIDNWNSEQIQRELQSCYENLIPRDRTIRLHLLTEGPKDTLQMHDRFFLTKHGGINFGHGFVPGKSRSVNAFVLDETHHREQKATYIDGVARHDEGLPKTPGVRYPKAVDTFTVKSGS
jgi:hypothetical protein